MSNGAGAAGSINRGVRRGALQVVEVVDQPVQRRTGHPGHILHADISADGPSGSTRRRQHPAGAEPLRAPRRISIPNYTPRCEGPTKGPLVE